MDVVFTTKIFRTLFLILSSGCILVFSGCSDSTDTVMVEAVLGRRGKSPGKFDRPRSLALHPSNGTLCVVDRSGRIQRFVRVEDADRNTQWKFLNFWNLPEYLVGQPTGLNFDRDGNLLVADTHYFQILVYNTENGELLRSWGRRGQGDGEFTQVRDVIQDRAGFIFAADYGGAESRADRIQKFDADGTFIKSFGSSGTGPGQFGRPQGLALAMNGERSETLLVSDSCNHRIQRFSVDGEFLQEFGSIGSGPGEFKYPYGISVENKPAGDIFVVEWGNSRIQRFDSKGNYLASCSGPGREVGLLATPWDIALSDDGRLYVADYENNRIQIFRWPMTVAIGLKNISGRELR